MVIYLPESDWSSIFSSSSFPGLALRGKGNISDGSALRTLAAHSLRDSVWQRRSRRSSFVCVWVRCFLSVAFSKAAPFHIQSLINMFLRSPDWKYSEHPSSINSPWSAKPWQTDCSLTSSVKGVLFDKPLTWASTSIIHLSGYMPTGIRLIVDVSTQFTSRACVLRSPLLDYWRLASYFSQIVEKTRNGSEQTKARDSFLWAVHFYYDVSVSTLGQL